MNVQANNPGQSDIRSQFGEQSNNFRNPYQMRPLKDKSIAMILEILPGLFGLYGFGWIYSGNSSTGIMLLVGGLIWDFIAILSGVLTAGFACFCTIPVNILVITFSSMRLNTYIKEHPELFGV